MAAKKKSTKKAAGKKAAKKKTAAGAKKSASVAKKKTAGVAKKKTAGAAKKTADETLEADAADVEAPAAAAAPPAEAAPAAAPAAAPPVEEEEAPPREPKPIAKMPKRAKAKRGIITLALGAEADAAFMVYALAAEKVDTEDRRYELIRKHQHVLDDEAQAANVDVTMLSLGAYPRVDDRYMLLPCGGSFGDHRGPILVARSPIRSNEVEGLAVAVPGNHSTAAIALRLWLPKGTFAFQSMPARQISLMVRADRMRSGLLVTEDQLTYRNHGLVRVVDLGQWWGEETEGLPLPLTMCGIRRDIEPEERAKIALDLKRSIAYALGHREEALGHALQFARKALPDDVDKFVDRYVNDLSLDCGERGRQAIQLLFDRATRIDVFDEDIWPEYHGLE